MEWSETYSIHHERRSTHNLHESVERPASQLKKETYLANVGAQFVYMEHERQANASQQGFNKNSPVANTAISYAMRCNIVEILLISDSSGT